MIGDPSIFLDFLQMEPKTLHGRKFRGYRKNHPYCAKFMIMAHQGDIKLSMHSNSVAWELFGADNRELTQLVLSDWKSNDNWTDLALFYKFDQYLTWLPKSIKESGWKRNHGKVKKVDKLWADLWEAWWAGIFFERELWNDDIVDLLSILRRLMFLRYRPLVEHFSTGHRLIQKDQSDLSHIIPNVSASLTEVYGDDERIVECLGPRPTDNDEIVPFGYLITFSIPVNSTSDCDLSSQTDQYSYSIFATTKETAISKASTYAGAGYRGMIHYNS